MPSKRFFVKLTRQRLKRGVFKGTLSLSRYHLPPRRDQ